MRTIQRITCLLILLCGWVHVQAAEPDPLFDLSGLMEQMATVAERHDGFVETREVSLLTQPVTLRGTLVYRRPHYIEKRIEHPKPERLVVDGTELRLTEGTSTRTVDIASHPIVRAYVEAIRATLAGDISTLREHYHITLEGSFLDWTLRLQPLHEEAAQHLLAVLLRGHQRTIRSVEIHEAGGDRSVMTIGENGS